MLSTGASRIRLTVKGRCGASPHAGAHAASIITQLTITPGPVLTPTLRDILGILAPPVQGSHLPPRKTIKLYALPTGGQRLGSHRLCQLGSFLRTMTAVHHSRATSHNTRTDTDGACQDRTENQGSDHHGFLLCLCPLPLFSALCAFNITEQPCVQAVYQEASCCVNRGEKLGALKEKHESE